MVESPAGITHVGILYSGTQINWLQKLNPFCPVTIVTAATVSASTSWTGNNFWNLSRQRLTVFAFTS